MFKKINSKRGNPHGAPGKKLEVTQGGGEKNHWLPLFLLEHPFNTYSCNKEVHNPDNFWVWNSGEGLLSNKATTCAKSRPPAWIPHLHQ